MMELPHGVWLDQRDAWEGLRDAGFVKDVPYAHLCTVERQRFSQVFQSFAIDVSEGDVMFDDLSPEDQKRLRDEARADYDFDDDCEHDNTAMKDRLMDIVDRFYEEVERWVEKE